MVKSISLTIKELKETILKTQEEEVASKQAYGMPEHMICIGVLWTIVRKGYNMKEMGNHIIKGQIWLTSMNGNAFIFSFWGKKMQ